MNEAVLLVDDESYVLEALRRQLCREFPLVAASGADEALTVLKERGPFFACVSDYRMPGMDGIALLTQVRAISPQTVRLLLTGHADLRIAIDAINRGQLFRFLIKPCAPDHLIQSLRDALAQYRLITAEQELREQTLTGSLQVLCDILALLNPEAFGRATRIARIVDSIARSLPVDDPWTLKTAAMLSQVGCILLPEEIVRKVYRSEPLTPQESQLWNQHPYVAADLLKNIPRMQSVARIIADQDKRYDGQGVAVDRRKGSEIPLEARILKVALDFDALQAAGVHPTLAYDQMKHREGWYDPDVLDALRRAFADIIRYEIRAVSMSDLAPGMILQEDVRATTGILLAAKGQPVTDTMIARLSAYSTNIGVRQPISVMVPIQ